MSYDLFFIKTDLSHEQFASYFSGRSNYSLNGEQALYNNEDTGVYFSFDYSSEKPESEEEVDYCASFNINYFRPHFFALEAEPEVRSFVDKFGFKILDPQKDGIEGDAYSTQGFLHGWNAGNEFTFESCSRHESTPLGAYARPTDELEAIWRWNYARKKYQQQLGEDIFAPKISFVLLNHKLLSTIIWTDAIPTLIPRVDLVGIYRMDLAPRRPQPRRKYLPRRTLQRGKEDMCFASFDKVQPLIGKYEVQDYPLPAFLLDYPSPPDNILRFVKSLKAFKEKIDSVSMDQIVNAELMEKYGIP